LKKSSGSDLARTTRSKQRKSEARRSTAVVQPKSSMSSQNGDVSQPLNDIAGLKTDGVDLELGITRDGEPLMKDHMVNKSAQDCYVLLMKDKDFKQQDISQSCDTNPSPATLEGRSGKAQGNVQRVNLESCPASIEDSLAKLQGTWHDSQGQEIHVDGKKCKLDKDQPSMLLIDASQIVFNGWYLVDFASKNNVVRWQRDGDFMQWCSVDARAMPQKFAVASDPEQSAVTKSPPKPRVVTKQQEPAIATPTREANMESESQRSFCTILEEDDEEMMDDSDSETNYERQPPPKERGPAERDLKKPKKKLRTSR